MATDTGAFRVETIEIDLPSLAGALTSRLHAEGVPVTPARTADFAMALALVRPVSWRRLYWTARAVLVTDPTQVAAFDGVFFSIFGDHEPTEPAQDAPLGHAEPDARPTPERGSAPGEAATRHGRQGRWSSSPASGDSDGADTDVPLAMASDEERLASKRFDTLDSHELAQLSELMTRLRLATPKRTTRRQERGRHGQRIDMRRTLRQSLRTGGDPMRLARRRRRATNRRLVLLCDISGSMEPYARAYLQFLTCAAGSGPRVESFVFATRLTRITRALAARQPQRAVERAAAAAPDWSSGTRIGDALKSFNDLHGRRGMARGAVIVILSDGWERGDPDLVAREMERLGRLAHRIVWVNPRISASTFAPRAGGMAAALPHCDALVSGHSFEALGEVIEAIGAESLGWDSLPSFADPETVEQDTWTSAIPVPGSSVAMPSGYGPSRGNTTAGWVTDEGKERPKR